MPRADTFTSSTARKLPVKFRPDLTAERQTALGQSYWILKDPIGARYFRLQEEEYALLKLFNGNHSLDEIKKAFEKQFPPQKITLDELQHLLGQFHQSGLIIASTPHQGEELLKRSKKRKRKELTQKLTNILAIKFKGIDPDAIFTFVYPFVRWCFHPLTLSAGLLLCLSALLLILVQFDIFRAKLPEFYTFFSPVNILCLSVVLAATKVLHEFGHGLTAKHFGGECHEMGVMILVLTPCLYVNVSDSWLLPNKWHRIAIAAAGVCVECTLAAICTFVWWFSVPGLLHYLALNIMFVSSVSTILFNVNPLLRYDGYYMLSDYLEIPNLRQKATKILTQKCSQWFLGMEPPDDPFLPKKNQLWFASYSVAAFCYRWVIMASILFFIYTLFKHYELRIVGQALAAMSLFSLFVMPIYKVIKFFWIPGRIYKVKARRFYSSLALFAGFLLFLLFFPLPYTVVAPAIVELRTVTAQQVFVPDIKGGNQLREVHVVPGQFVQAGDVLARLENPVLRMELVEAEGRTLELEQELKALESMTIYRSESAGRIGPQQQSLAVARELLQNKRQDVESLILRAPLPGIVCSPPWKLHQPLPDDQLPSWWGTPLEPQNLGATLEPGTVLCSVGDPKFLEAILIVDQSRTPFLKKDQRVELRLHEFPDRTFFGEVEEIEQQPVSALDIQLSTRMGGEVPTTSKNGVEEPNRPSYRVRMLLENDTDLSVRMGMTGVGKIHVERQTLGYRLWLLVNETFNFKL
jgi:putative peptide zinc metalloprotease protein